MRIIALLLSLATNPIWAQYLASAYNPGGVVQTPTLVSASGKNSMLTIALGTSGGAGQISASTCASYSYCLPYAENSLSGNLGIVAWQYANGGTTVAATVADDKSDSYTELGSSSADTNKQLDMAYFPNLPGTTSTNGAHKVSITFGTTAVTQVQADVAMFYNVATSSPLRTSNSTVGTSSTTMTGPTLSTSANDLVYAYFCRTGTPLMTSGAFTPGSGFTLAITKYQDGCASEYEVSAGGNVTPTMTMGSASTYIVYAAAFKAASSPSGTAPTAPYLRRMVSWSSASGVSASTTKFQFPNAANSLLVVTESGATNYSATSITDSGSNTWTHTGGCTALSGVCAHYGGLTSNFISQNAAVNSTATQTINFTGTGDATVFSYEFVGMPANSFTGQTTNGSSTNTTNLLPLTAISNLLLATHPLVVANGPISFNTAVSLASPAGFTNYFDAGYFGSMTASGGSTPESVIDQNNIWSHSYAANITSAQSFQWNASVTESDSPNGIGVDLMSFLINAGIGIINTATAQGTSGSTLAITVPSTIAGDTLVVATGFYDGATLRTVSKICTDGTTCAAGHSFSQLSGAASAGVASTLLGTDIWYLSNSTAGVTTVTITYSGTITTADAAYWQLVKGDGSSATADGSGNHVHSGASCSTTCTGAAVTPSGSADFCLGIIETSGTGVTANPKSGNAFVYTPTATFTSGGAATALLTILTTAQTPVWTTAAGTFNSSTGCFK